MLYLQILCACCVALSLDMHINWENQDKCKEYKYAPVRNKSNDARLREQKCPNPNPNHNTNPNHPRWIASSIHT